MKKKIYRETRGKQYNMIQFWQSQILYKLKRKL